MIFGSKIFTDEIQRLRDENARKDTVIVELIDKFIHNRVPERIVTVEAKQEVEAFEEGSGDPVSVAERDAYNRSRPIVADYLQGMSAPLDMILDEG